MISCQPETELALDNELYQLVQDNSQTDRIDYFRFPDSGDMENLPLPDLKNTPTAAKAQLGNFLFFETGLAQTALDEDCFETYSCATCHVPTAGFLPGRVQGIADGAFGFGENGENRTLLSTYSVGDIDAQGVRPMNPLNSGYSINTLWNGKFGSFGLNIGTEEYWTDETEINHHGLMGLEAQNIEALKLHRMSINDRVLDTLGYRSYFDAAFPELAPDERYTDETAAFALSIFLRSFLANKAPFQQWLNGDYSALNRNEKQGAILFFGKAGCSSCHNGPSLGSSRFYRIGTSDLYQNGGLKTSVDDPVNLGRGSFTGAAWDMRKFKVPQLYNIKDYAFYFHGSSKSSIEDVVDYKVRAESENPMVTNEEVALEPRELTNEEKYDLVQFLKHGLYDDGLDRYVPSSLPSGYCFPNNDAVSQVDLNCQ